MEIVIKGITRQGRTFRPSDWAQRLATAVATLGPDRRIIFHPKVHVATRQGLNCVVADASLRDEEPALFKFLMGFAEGNELLIEETTADSRHVA